MNTENRGDISYEIPENAIIITIEEDYEANGMIGLLITTDKGNISLMIDSSRDCCEEFGNLFFETPDDLSIHIGATLLDVRNIEVNNSSYIDKYGLDMGGETQLKITTSKGVLQYAVYNVHNGYYSHAVITQIFNTTKEEYI